MNDLVKQAKANLEKAYATLGARPGPGYDIVISPTNPISDRWKVEGRTDFGRAWLKHMLITSTQSNLQLAIIKQEITGWGGSFHTDWSCVRTERVDP